MLVPRFSGLAALGLVCLMAGATFINLFVLDTNPLTSVIPMLVGGLVAWGRWPRTKILLGRPGR